MIAFFNFKMYAHLYICSSDNKYNELIFLLMNLILNKGFSM